MYERLSGTCTVYSSTSSSAASEMERCRCACTAVLSFRGLLLQLMCAYILMSCLFMLQIDTELVSCAAPRDRMCCVCIEFVQSTAQTLFLSIRVLFQVWRDAAHRQSRKTQISTTNRHR